MMKASTFQPTGLPRPALTIAIVDYGMGNLASVQNALTFLGHRPVVTSQADALRKADAIILPGVGAFGVAMQNLSQGGLTKLLTKLVMNDEKPFLGICLGMQLIACQSVEWGIHDGLGWVDAHVEPLDPTKSERIPHVGWTSVSDRDDILFAGLSASSTFYFDHSFHMVCDPKFVAGHAWTGQSVVAAVRWKNVFATQFHPEKSQRSGLKLLRNFTDFCIASSDGYRERAASSATSFASELS